MSLEPPPAADIGVDPRIVRRKVGNGGSCRSCSSSTSRLPRPGQRRLRLAANERKLPGFTARSFGWDFGIFFVGYLLLEIPGALLVERWSARKWFARILITWGLCSPEWPWCGRRGKFLPGAVPARSGGGRLLPRRDRVFHPLVPAGRARPGFGGAGARRARQPGVRRLGVGGLLAVNWFGLGRVAVGVSRERDCRRWCWARPCRFF